jgi:anion-transporting  ArsA/GET3 family ATPase
MDKIDNIPVFDTKEDAEDYARGIGCEGHHTHEHEGKLVYMPCKEHGEVLDAIQDYGEDLEDMLDNYEIVQIRVVDDPESVSKRYMKRLSKKLESQEMTSEKFYSIVSNPNEPSVLDIPNRRFRYIYAPGEGAPDLIDTSRSFCTRMMGFRQRVYRYEDIMDLSAQLEVEDRSRRIIPRPRTSGPVDIWTWKGGAGCLHRFIELWFEPRGYIPDNAKVASEESQGQAPAAGNTGQINLPPNYASGFAKVGERGGITESKKAPKSDTKNPDPKGEGTAKGDASGKRGAKVTEAQEKTLQKKVDDFNEKESNTKNGRATLGALKSVFQRGLGAYNTSHSPAVKSAEQWAYARVNAFLYLVKNGRPENSKYTTDYDLLPKDHPKAKDNFEYEVGGLPKYESTTGSTVVEFIEKNPNETKDDYLGRCMGSKLMKDEYADEKQRYAVCISDYESFSKGSRKIILVDIDDTLISGGKPIMKTIEYIDEKKDDYRIVVVSGRPVARLAETKRELDDLEIYYDEIYLQDFAEETSGEVGKKFKEYKAKKLIDSGFQVVEAIENDEETRDVYDQLGIHSMSPESVDVNFKPVAFSGGYGIFPDKETAMEYSMFCGCGGMIEDYMFKGEKMYLGCSKKKKNLSFSLDDEKRIIYTPIMLAGKMIPRVNAMGEKYYVKFTPESIQKMAYKYLKEKRTDMVNYEHTNQKMEDVYMVESWIVEGDQDKAYKWFTKEQIPVGSWMAAFKVDSDDVWENYVKANKVRGASLQGNFLYVN